LIRRRSDFNAQVEHCLNDDVRGKAIVERLRPEADDYFVLKPKHSGFFSTTLDILLDYLGVKTVILTGIAGDICVLFTANDAYMRDFELFVPGDCLASNTAEENHHALSQMSQVLKADTRPSTELDLNALGAGNRCRQGPSRNRSEPVDPAAVGPFHQSGPSAQG
jgi:nicotinamidase-related amidase